MRKILAGIVSATLIAGQAQAADWQDRAAIWQDRTVGVQPGTFVGARLRLSLGGQTAARPQAALTIAPTLNRSSTSGTISTTIGEGISLNFGPKAKPTLTLAGVRADTALGLHPQIEVDGDQKLGLSKGGKIAIGVVAVLAVAAGTSYVVLSNRCTECDQ